MQLPPTHQRIPLRDKMGDVRDYAIVDEEDYVRFGHLRWHLNNHGYAMRTEGGRANRCHVKLHREILGLGPDDGREVDHINRDRLDNRRANLRVVSHGENMQNQSGHGGSKHRGVSYCRQTGRWKAYLTMGGRMHWGGRFDAEEEAAVAASELRLRLMTHSGDEPHEGSSALEVPASRRAAGITRASSSGYPNVFRDSRRNRWYVQVTRKGVTHWGGSYRTPEEANDAAKALRGRIKGVAA